MLIFGLHSTYDDQLSDKSQPKCKKMATKSSKNETNEIFSVALYRFPDGK